MPNLPDPKQGATEATPAPAPAFVYQFNPGDTVVINRNGQYSGTTGTIIGPSIRRWPDLWPSDTPHYGVTVTGGMTVVFDEAELTAA